MDQKGFSVVGSLFSASLLPHNLTTEHRFLGPIEDKEHYEQYATIIHFGFF